LPVRAAAARVDYPKRQAAFFISPLLTSRPSPTPITDIPGETKSVEGRKGPIAP